MRELFKSAIKAAKSKQPKYRMDYTVMKQVYDEPVPIDVPKEQKKKKSLLQPVQYAPPRVR